MIFYKLFFYMVKYRIKYSLISLPSVIYRMKCGDNEHGSKIKIPKKEQTNTDLYKDKKVGLGAMAE